jgi:5-methylcytosine-specific restriction endonuclease McrA
LAGIGTGPPFGVAFVYNKQIMKECTLCKQTKEQSNFTKRTGTKDGLEYRCKDCIKAIRGDKYKGKYLYADLSPEARSKEKLRKKKYKRDHPEIVSTINRMTYVSRKNLSIECTNAEVKQFISEHKVCVRCGSTEELTLDHIIPVSWGILSRHALDNFQMLCNHCNGLKKNLSSIDFRVPEMSQFRLIPCA